MQPKTLPQSDGFVGHMEFFSAGNEGECPICLEHIFVDGPSVAHGTCKKPFHTNCLLGWALDASNGRSTCPNDRQQLLSELRNDEASCRETQHFELMMRLEQLTWRDYGMWTYGWRYIRDPQKRTESIQPFKIDLDGNARSSIDLAWGIPLTQCEVSIAVIPRYFEFRSPNGARDEEWLYNWLKNGNSNTHSETPEDSGWRVLRYRAWARNCSSSSLATFLAYVAPERRKEEVQATEALNEWRALQARDQAGADPKIPTWRVTDYDEAWLTYCFLHRDNEHVDHTRENVHEYERAARVDLWEDEFVLGEYMLAAFADTGLFGGLREWEFNEALALFKAWTTEPGDIVRVEERFPGIHRK